MGLKMALLILGLFAMLLLVSSDVASTNAKEVTNGVDGGGNGGGYPGHGGGGYPGNGGGYPGHGGGYRSGGGLCPHPYHRNCRKCC